MNVAILANGEFPSSERTADYLKHADRIICCDGAAASLIEHGIEPDLITGDMDSLSPALAKRYGSIIRKVAEQQTNDLTKAFKAAMELNPDSIHILGATGKREDHTLANVSLLADYAEALSGSGCSIDMPTESGVFLGFCGQEISFRCPLDVEVSIFAFDNTLKIVSEGLLYRTDRVTFDTLWKATLNRSVAEQISFHLNHPAKVTVFICNPGL